jgi:hypothetical protein
MFIYSRDYLEYPPTPDKSFRYHQRRIVTAPILVVQVQGVTIMGPSVIQVPVPLMAR